MSAAGASTSTVNGSTPGQLPDESAAAAVSSEIRQVKDKITELEEEIKRLSSDIEQAKKERDIDMVKLLLADKTALQEKENLLLKQLQEARTSAATTSGLGGWVRDLTCEGVESNPGPCVHEEGSASAPHRCRCQLTKEELRELGVPLLGKCPSPTDGGCGHAFNLHTSAATLQQPTAHGQSHACFMTQSMHHVEQVQ